MRLRAPVHGTLQGICRDSKDDMIFECAINSHARFIVSGDKDVLTVRSYQGIRAVTAREYVDRVP